MRLLFFENRHVHFHVSCQNLFEAFFYILLPHNLLEERRSTRVLFPKPQKRHIAQLAANNVISVDMSFWGSKFPQSREQDRRTRYLFT
jgi:hypothetical protein